MHLAREVARGSKIEENVIVKFVFFVVVEISVGTLQG